MIVLVIIAALVSIGCLAPLAIAAFQSAAWKGIVGCATAGLYLVYFGLAEYKSQYKLPLVLGYLAGAVVAFVLLGMGAGAKDHGVPNVSM